jgi:hypothetical protein
MPVLNVTAERTTESIVLSPKVDGQSLHLAVLVVLWSNNGTFFILSLDRVLL